MDGAGMRPDATAVVSGCAIHKTTFNESGGCIFVADPYSAAIAKRSVAPIK
jgi:hypothetical protein